MQSGYRLWHMAQQAFDPHRPVPPSASARAVRARAFRPATSGCATGMCATTVVWRPWKVYWPWLAMRWQRREHLDHLADQAHVRLGPRRLARYRVVVVADFGGSRRRPALSSIRRIRSAAPALRVRLAGPSRRRRWLGSARGLLERPLVQVGRRPVQ